MKLARIIVLFLLFPQFVFAADPLELSGLVDEYHYAMTVEWDQRDQLFAQAAQQKFTAGLEQLVKAGLSEADMQQVTGVNFAAMKYELQFVDRHDSAALRELMLSHIQRSQGASWNGEVLLGAGVVAAFLLILIIPIMQANRKFDACVAAHGGDENACIER